MKNDSVIKIEDLFFAHGKKEVLKGVSLEIPKGQIWGLVGPNGTGKTTLLKILAGLYKADKGTVLINDVNMKDFPTSIYNEIGVMIEDTASYENLSGFENVKIIANMYNFDNKDEKIKELFKLADLEKAMYDKVKTYSLGMKQRLGLIMTLLNEPKVLLLDEPTNGLDIDGIRKVREIITEYASKKAVTVIISSHIVSELKMVCDHIAFMINGKVRSVNDINDFEKISIEDYYVNLVEVNKCA